MLRFEKKLNVTPDNLEDLSEIQRAQLFDAYPKWFGKEPASIEAMFLGGEDEEGIALCEFYQVYEGEDATEPKYDVWIVNVDTGLVYESGTVLDTGIGMIQNYFQQIESDDKELAHELHSAFVRYIQQTWRQKKEKAAEEESDEQTLANALAQEVVNGRSETEYAQPSEPIASRAAKTDATLKPAKSKGGKKLAATSAKKTVKKSAQKAKSGKAAAAKKAKANPAAAKKKIAKTASAKKAMPAKTSAKKPTLKAKSTAKKAAAKKKKPTASQTKKR